MTQVQQALEDFSSLRSHLQSAGHNINELGSRLIQNEAQLTEELNRNRDVTEGGALEAQVGRRNAESLEERLGIFQKPLQEAESLRNSEIADVALEQVRLATCTSRPESSVDILSSSVANLPHLQKVTLTTVKDMAVSLQELGRAVQAQGAWIVKKEMMTK